VLKEVSLVLREVSLFLREVSLVFCLSFRIT
jgi:hypothetical protein